MRSASVSRTIGWGLACLTLLAACAGSRGDALRAASPTGATTDEIARLEASVARDREALAELVSRPRDIELDPLHADEEIREIAVRLSRDTQALEALRGPAPMPATAPETARP